MRLEPPDSPILPARLTGPAEMEADGRRLAVGMGSAAKTTRSEGVIFVVAHVERGHQLLELLGLGHEPVLLVLHFLDLL